jgi:hypothetical protein
MAKVNHERGSSAPSVQALADRDRRAGLRPTTTTALLMGDPVAGADRSALDDRLRKRRDQIRQTIYQWIRDDAPTGLKMMMSSRLTELLISRIVEAMAE